MGGVTRAEFRESDVLRTLADELDRGEVTHLVVALRRGDGTEGHLELGDVRSATYLVGLLERMKLDLHDGAEWAWGPGEEGG